MSAYGDERIFPVPAIVDPSCKIEMQAHFKLGKHGMVTPRLYYLDHWAKSGAVYIGYIGRHLTNTQTRLAAAPACPWTPSCQRRGVHRC